MPLRVSGEPHEAGVVSHRAESGMGPGHLDGTASIRWGCPCPAMDACRIQTRRVGAELRGDLLGHRSRCAHECCWLKGPFVGLRASPDISCPSSRIPRGGIAGETGHNPCAFRHFPPKPCPRGLLVEAQPWPQGPGSPGTRQERRQLLCRGGKSIRPSFFFPLWQPACPRKSTLWGVALRVRVYSSPLLPAVSGSGRCQPRVSEGRRAESSRALAFPCAATARGTTGLPIFAPFCKGLSLSHGNTEPGGEQL